MATRHADRVISFSSQTFLAIQITLSALPFLLFVSFTLATIVLAVVAALAFCIFWIGAALMILVPTLFAAVFAGIFIWIWAVGTYIFGRFAYRRVYPRLQQSAVTASRLTERKSLQDGSARRSTGSAGPTYGTRSTNSNANINTATTNTTAPGVPEVVKRSINQAHESPEAAANEEAVEEKKALEQELMDEFGLAGRDYSKSNGQLNDNVTQKADVDGDYSKVEAPPVDQSPPPFLPGGPKFT